MAIPTVRIYNRQKAHRPNLPWLRRTVKAALRPCLQVLTQPDAPLAQLTEVEITIVSDAEIARVHADFMADPTPTDVITFHHGEVLVSADTALRQGTEHGQTLDHELALYMIHGLLHLAGWDDHDAIEAGQMAEHQFAILAAVTAR
jgi:probable rRNA maturation factor